ncbi:hypothetical protein AB4Z52_18045 [Rhizobium sp. 2YAF20]|uniref:hypothetical protein n=1 Tax=Rhizobium sp. 2YAF20 TaxID=3233027 RepID=UPI003F9AF7E7
MALRGSCGSELIGFDDELSKADNWGQRVHILLDRDCFGNYAKRLVNEVSKVAPSNYLGEPISWRSRPLPPANGVEAVGTLEHGLEFHTLEALLECHFAVGSVENLNALRWLGFAEQKLLAFMNERILVFDVVSKR